MSLSRNKLSSRARAVAMACALTLCGCSHNLGVAPLEGQSPVGAVYVLPMTQWELTMTWRLADCAGPPKIAVKVDAASSLVDDGSQAYVVDPASLQTLTSIGTFSAKWQEGSRALLSVNATAEDRTAAVVASAVTAVAKLAPTISSLAADETNKPPPPPPCTPDAQKTLALVAQQKGSLDVLNEQVVSSTAEIAGLTAKIATMGVSVDDRTKRRMASSMDRLAELKAKQAALGDALAANLAKVTSVRKIRWPETAVEAQGGPFEVDPAVLAKWFTDNSAAAPRVAVAIERVGSFGQNPSSGKLASDKVNGSGIRYRVPAQGRLLACTADKTPCTSGDPVRILTTVQGPVAQLGYVGRLPVRNRTFGSTSFSAEFTPEMALKSVGYEQKTAPAEGASAALSGAAASAAPLLSPTQRLKEETEYLKALKERRDATAALQPSPNGDAAKAKNALDADTSVLLAQTSNLQAQIALDQLKASLSK